MNNYKLRDEAKDSYLSLVKGPPFLVLLISSTFSIALSIMGNGIREIITQLFPVIMLIGLYIARSSNRTGVKMVQICAAILFWIHCIICSAFLISRFFIIVGLMSKADDKLAVTGSLAGTGIAVAVLLRQFFFPIFYYRNIQLIMKDVAGWFVCPEADDSNSLPSESRQRISCKLVLICIIQLVLVGIVVVDQLSKLANRNLIVNVGTMLLKEIVGNDTGSQIMGFLLPSPSFFTILALASTIAKLVCIILLYNQYQAIEISALPKKKSKVTTILADEPEQQSVIQKQSIPQKHPDPQKRIVKIILDREKPKKGHFSASMSSEMIVGRREVEANLVIKDDPAISGRHMRLLIKDNKLYAEDLGSHNGLYVNGNRVHRRTQIHRGDEIGMGDSVFVLTWER